MPLKRWLLFAAFIFLALLYSGGNRLMTTDAPAPPLPQRAQLPALPASLEAAPDKLPAPQAAPTQASPKLRAAPQPRTAAHHPCRPLLARDANGNVLRAGRYSRAVYQAFALGDMPG